MKRPLKRIARAVAFACAGLTALALAGLAAGARVNTSRSIPLGVYWVSSAPLQKGAYAMFCPPQRPVFEEARRRQYIRAGFCDGGYGYLMKQIAGTAGDAVEVGAEGVHVNGVVLPFSAPVDADRAGRPMPRLQPDRFVLGRDELLLMTDVSRTSFDARYFGPVDRSHVVAVVVPILTW